MRPEDITGKQVLYGCLDWGSGHVARSIPLMQQLVRQGNSLTVRCTFAQRSVFETYCVPATFIVTERFSFRFKGDGHFVKEMVRNAFRFRKAIHAERREVSALIDEHPFDFIVSDHCYGLHDPRVHSVFLTHQVQLPPRTGFPAQWIHRRWMKRFQTTWIMDDAEMRLAGKLSLPVANGVYIGHYSRFTGVVPEQTRGIVAVISGPEPYAQQLFDGVVRLANRSGGDWTIICGGTCTDKGMLNNGTIIRNNWKLADEAIIRAEWVLSRNGYSTLMDLQALGKKALLIPTPGQPEQLYLRKINTNPDWQYADRPEELGGRGFEC